MKPDWVLWEACPPLDREVEIEIFREGEPPFRAKPRELGPYFNISGLRWRLAAPPGKPKVIQIATDRINFYLLRDDGTVWVAADNPESWRKMRLPEEGG